MLSREDLHPYQIRAIDYIKDKKRCGLALAMGLGKTVASLTAISDMLDGFSANKVLVIAPLRVAKSVWPKEVTRWAHLSHLKVSVCIGSERQRLSALQTTADIYTINRENVPWLTEQFKGKWPFDCLIVDESSSFKNASSLRWKALKRILPHTSHMVLLTGTPSPNSLLDVWAQQYLIDYGMSLGRTMTGYKQRFFEQDYMGYKWSLKSGAAVDIQQLMTPNWLSMAAEDYLDLPERIDLVESIVLPEDVKDEYDSFEKTLLADLPDGEVVEAINAGALATKLLQWCLAEGTDVLTRAGWKKIEAITNQDVLYDGVDWVTCSGVVCNGYRSVVELDGVDMTPDHRILTVSGWQKAEDILNANDNTRFERTKVWDVDGSLPARVKPKQKHNLALSLRLRSGSCADWVKSYWEKVSSLPQIVRVQSWRNHYPIERGARHDTHKAVPYLVKCKVTLQQSERQGLSKLWGEGDTNVSRMGKLIFCILGRYATGLFGNIDPRSEKQRSGLLQRKLSVGDGVRAIEQHPIKHIHRHTPWEYDNNQRSTSVWNKDWDTTCEGDKVQLGGGKTFSNTKKVYDILNVGTRNRFVIRGKTGELLISHNCNGAIYTNEHKHWTLIHNAKIDALTALVEDNDEPMLVAYNFKSDLERLQKAFPNAVVLDKDPATIDRWNRGEIQMLLAHPQSAGHGLNLQDGGALCVWFGLSWSLEAYLQFNARLHRQGQTRPVRIIHLIAQGCLDERVMSVLQDKDAQQQSLLQALKR